SYQYFAIGYRERNEEIAKRLTEPGQVAVVTDIKAFYPSVKTAQIEEALENRLKRSELLAKSTEEILNFYRQLVGTGNVGIPIGPQSGHVLGHLALADVDEALTKQYGDNYFRYV